MPVRHVLAAGTAMALGFLTPITSHAGANSGARLVLHLASATTSQACARAAAHPACADVVTNGGLYPNPQTYFAYLLVAGGSASAGVAGAAMSVQYDSGPADGVGVDVFAWTLCATLQFTGGGNPQWPAPGTSSKITFDQINQCQRNEPGGPGTGVVATLGYFYCAAYAPATLRVGPYLKANDPDNNKAIIADCAANPDVIYDGAAPPVPSTLGTVQFSAGASQPGYSPCNQVIPVETTTWSRIKGEYR